MEALSVNPLIQLYEILLEMRTEWEKNHILGLKILSCKKIF